MNACCQVKKNYTQKDHLLTTGKASKKLSGWFGVNLKSPAIFSDTFACRATRLLLLFLRQSITDTVQPLETFMLDCEDIPARSDVLLCQPAL